MFQGRLVPGEIRFASEQMKEGGAALFQDNVGFEAHGFHQGEHGGGILAGHIGQLVIAFGTVGKDGLRLGRAGNGASALRSRFAAPGKDHVDDPFVHDGEHVFLQRVGGGVSVDRDGAFVPRKVVFFSHHVAVAGPAFFDDQEDFHAHGFHHGDRLGAAFGGHVGQLVIAGQIGGRERGRLRFFGFSRDAFRGFRFRRLCFGGFGLGRLCFGGLCRLRFGGLAFRRFGGRLLRFRLALRFFRFFRRRRFVFQIVHDLSDLGTGGKRQDERQDKERGCQCAQGLFHGRILS